MTVKGQRNANIELLRIISMLMVVTLHALGKSGVLVSPLASNHNAVAAWLLEFLSIVAVNVYVLISGYFLVKARFKIGRIIEFICQVLFYSVIGFLMGLSLGLIKPSELGIYELLQYVLPIHMNVYWFAHVYVIMYLLSPVLAIAANKLTKKQLSWTIVFLLLYESVIKSIIPASLTSDDFGYGILWFIVLFLSAAYIRLYGLPFIKKPIMGFAIYALGVVLLYVELTVCYLAGLDSAIARIRDYNNILIFASAIGLFYAFILMKERSGGFWRVVTFISPCTFGVYLLHEALPVRYEWQKWFNINGYFNTSLIKFAVSVFASVICVFVVGIIVDFIRKSIFDFVRRKAGNTRLAAALNKLNGVMNGEV